MSRSLVIVNYRSAHLAARAIATARRASETALRVVVVDNSSEPAEWDALRGVGADELIRTEGNPGYGVAANLGAARLQDDVLLVANPDVEFFPGAIDALAGELASPGVVLAGPRFVWDSDGTWFLPPPDRPTPGGALARALAGRSRVVEEIWRRRRRLARIAFWQQAEPRDAAVLSGAVLCFRRDAFQEIAGFDPAYRLYFEEIDLMMRLRARGGRIRHVPAARVRHLYNQSGLGNPEAGALYAASEMLFYRRWLGEKLGPRLLRWRTPLPGPEVVSPEEGETALAVPPGAWVLEASPLPDLETAAGRFTDGGEVKIPREILATLHGTALWVQRVNRRTGAAEPAVRLF